MRHAPRVIEYSRIVTGQYLHIMERLDIVTAHKTKYSPGSERERERERDHWFAYCIPSEDQGPTLAFYKVLVCYCLGRRNAVITLKYSNQKGCMLVHRLVWASSALLQP